MKTHTFIMFLGVVSVSGFLAGCASTKVERVKVEETIDLSGQWNDSDARLVAEEMIKNCLEGAWLSEFHRSSSGNPTVIVGSIMNRTDEHINPSVFIKSLEANLINSGQVTFVASPVERSTVREERKEQNEAGWTDPATVKPIGKETGADFMLQGTINAVTDEVKGKSVIFYQVNLELVDLTTNQIKWIGQTELKKFVQRKSYSI